MMQGEQSRVMLAIEFADFGFGTVVGAIVTGSILILLDQRRRKDEQKATLPRREAAHVQEHGTVV
jgi:hypothetical protein